MGRTLSVKQINQYMKGMFEDELLLHNVNVVGEIFEFNVSGNHTFLTLKEEDMSLECYRYGKTEDFQKGAKVLLTGSVVFYAKSGKVSFKFHAIQYHGEGELFAAYLRLKAQLEAEGLFAGKHPLPNVIRTVSLISSMSGAVIHDFLSILKKSRISISVELYDVNVQGKNAAQEIVRALHLANEADRSDCIVLARGGGSLADLAPFNTEAVARSVAGSRIPVLSAVGHETDYTLCDFCSAERSGTPSIAAETILSVNHLFLDSLFAAIFRLDAAIAAVVRANEKRLIYLSHKITAASESKLRSSTQAIQSRMVRSYTSLTGSEKNNRRMIFGRMEHAIHALQQKTLHSERVLSESMIKLDGASPLKILARGYAKVTDGARALTLADIHSGQTIKIILFSGYFTAKADQIVWREST